MFSTLSSYFSRIKRHFYRAVEEARQPCKRPIDELSDDEDVIKSKYTPVRKKNCTRRDEPLLAMTRTLHFTPTLRCQPQKRSPLRPIPEDESLQPRVDTSEIKIINFKKPSSIQSSTVSPWTPVWAQEQDSAPSTYRRIIPPRFKTSSKQKRVPGSNEKKEPKIQRSYTSKGRSEYLPQHCLTSSSKKWKSFTVEESFRIEEKKQYQQLLERCTSTPSPSSSHSVIQMSSSSSDSSSPPPSPVFKVRGPKKHSHSIHPEVENENIIPTPSSERLPRSKKFDVPICRRKKDCLQDIRSYLSHDKGTKPLQSEATPCKNATNGAHKRVESVIKYGKQPDEDEEEFSLLRLIRRREERESSSKPLIDLAESDSDSLPILRISESDSDGVEIMDEFPHGRKKDKLFSSMFEKERKKYMQCKYGSLTQATDIQNDDSENESESNERISHLYSKVKNRMKLLDIISDSEDKRGRQARRVKPPFVHLTPRMLAEIDAALIPSPKSEVLVHNFNIKITRRDIHTLKGLNWLNDEIINFYMNLIMDRSKDNNRPPSVYALNTFFYPKLMNSGHQSVSRWTKKVDIFAYDILLVPIHLGVHWCMATVDFKKKFISYYDSMLGNNDKCLQLLLNYLEKEHLDKKKAPYRTKGWKLENMKDIPEQMNGSDCGVFACQFAEHKSRQAQMAFDQEDMPYFRRRMVYEIINSILLE